MKLYLLSDTLTATSLQVESSCSITQLKNSWLSLLKMRKQDILFVESAWNGYKNSWKYHIASYPDYPRRNNNDLKRVVERAKSLGIPTVFWNKEDGVHFERFIDSAKLFDHVFTVDENCIPRYKEVMGQDASIHPLMFAVQPKFHYFNGFDFKYNRANFVGSYSKHIHPERRSWQKGLFQSASESGLGLSVFDRNSDRKSDNYRYPKFTDMSIESAVPYAHTAQIYRDYLVSLNVNTVVDSPTMFSRRLIEILACGGVAVTTPSLSVEKMFKDFCYVVHDQAEMLALFSRLKEGPSKLDLERAAAGAEYIKANHTWAHRLETIFQVVR